MDLDVKEINLMKNKIKIEENIYKDLSHKILNHEITKEFPNHTSDKDHEIIFIWLMLS